MNQQATFATALLDPARPCPPGLLAWNSSDPARRFAVYRNNVVVSLIEALAEAFPVTRELVGEDFFRAMARVFALARPPASAMMVDYGSDFADFIAAFPPAASLPYLADVARLERCRIEAYHAADAAPLDAARLAAALADPDLLPELCLALHPSLRLLASDYAIVSLWAAHQGVGELAGLHTSSPECALILRCGLDVETTLIPPEAGAFVSCLQSGRRLEEAMAAATTVDAAFDPAFIITTLIEKGALCALRHQGEQDD